MKSPQALTRQRPDAGPDKVVFNLLRRDKFPKMRHTVAVFAVLFLFSTPLWPQISRVPRAPRPIPSAPVPSPASLDYPIQGATQVELTVPFKWRGSPEGVYRLWIGSAPGLSDVYDSGEITVNQVVVHLQPSTVYYARLFTSIRNRWMAASDVLFTTVAPAMITSPGNGTILNDGPIQFTWNAVPHAAAYYLYVGSTPGAKDIIDSGELNQLQLSHTLSSGVYYANIYTEIDQVWYGSASVSFSVHGALLAFPADGAVDIDPVVKFSWAPVSGASAYSLAVGTSPGDNDALTTGSITATSVQVNSPLQPNSTYYVQLGTMGASGWTYSNSSFTTGTGIAHLLSPRDGATNVDPLSKLNWNAISDAQAYSVWVGSGLGLKDVYAGGEIVATSLTVSGLQPQTRYFVRLWTKKNSNWYSADSSFTTSNGISHMVYPADKATNIDPSLPFKWSTDPLALAYRLTVGTLAGAADLYDSGEILSTSLSLSLFREPGTYYVRLFTKRTDGWHFVDSSFALGEDFIAHLLTPANEGVADPFASFTWTPVPNVTSYFLYVGTTVGTMDVFGSGETTATSVFVPNLNTGSKYFARLFTFRGGVWYYDDSTFVVGKGPAVLSNPAGGSTISPLDSFSWPAPDGGADAYQLTIGTSPSARDVFDSGQIQSTSIRPMGLDFGKTYYATLYTLKAGIWLSTSSIFNTFDQASTPNLDQLKSSFYSNIESATATVRSMADPQTGLAVPGTPLDTLVQQSGLTKPNCFQFSLVLQDQLQQVGILGRLRKLTLTGTDYESHMVIEYYEPFLQKWAIADATFGVTYFDPNTQTGQSVEEVQALVVANDFADIHVRYVTTFGDSILRQYYLDPVTLYLNIYPVVDDGTPVVRHSPKQFLKEVTTSDIIGITGVYLFEFAQPSDQLQATIWNGPIILTPQSGTMYSQGFAGSDGWTLDVAPPELKTYIFVRPMF